MPIFWRRPLTRLEMALYAAIVSAALALFADQLVDYLELAERSSVDTTVARLNSSINVQLAYDMLGGRLIPLEASLRRNPFELAKMPQGNFLGELDDPDLSALERGNWVFDRTKSELVYLPRLRRGLRTTEGNDVLRFRLVKRSGSWTYMLAPTSKYTWE